MENTKITYLKKNLNLVKLSEIEGSIILMFLSYSQQLEELKVILFLWSFNASFFLSQSEIVGQLCPTQTTSLAANDKAATISTYLFLCFPSHFSVWRGLSPSQPVFVHKGLELWNLRLKNIWRRKTKTKSVPNQTLS